MARPQSLYMYVGTFTRAPQTNPARRAEGISVFRLDPTSGALTLAGVTRGIASPAWLAVHPSRRFLYCVNEEREFNGQLGGGVSAFAVDQTTGELTLLNAQSAGAPGPCHLAVDRTGRYVMVSTYLGGTVAMYPIEPDGRLSPACDFHQHTGMSVHPQRQTHAYAHSINLDPANRFALVADLGLDKVIVYEVDLGRGKLISRPELAVSVAPGDGPRHMAFHPSARFVYLINEMGGTITAFSYDSDRGLLRKLQTVSTLPEGFTGFRSTAEILVHPSGKFLYGTNRSYDSSNNPNRGQDSIVIYAIDEENGRLSLVGYEPTRGEIPRNFTIDPRGTFLFVANQKSDSIVTFRIDQMTGQLNPTGQVITTPTPVCLQITSLSS